MGMFDLFCDLVDKKCFENIYIFYFVGLHKHENVSTMSRVGISFFLLHCEALQGNIPFLASITLN